ncbi:MAG: rRNA pseudouridine synthase, partial [Oscillospiraceae bacterium]|nr:rRNA pseudouridine synthase [Oscillospiraceae bacterium]
HGDAAPRGGPPAGPCGNGIAGGGVTVDGAVASLGDAADPLTQRIEIDGVPLPDVRRPVYIVLYKPRGVVTTRSDEKNRRTVLDLLPPELRHVVPAGRLDISSEGLLILTNDGAAVYALTHPKHEVGKTYLAWCQTGGEVSVERAMAVLRRPMTLDGQDIRPARCREVSPGLLSITIHEGKNRQVRRMCEHAGLHVTRLKRCGEGRVSLDGLKPGCWRHLTPEELSWLDALKAASPVPETP